jgi:hypothetical protein
MSQLMFEHRQVGVRGVLIPGRPLLNAIPQRFFTPPTGISVE